MQIMPNCKLCESTDVFDFFQLPPVPTQDGVMLQSEAEALSAPKGQINLRFCKDCGYIRNEGYEAAKVGFDAYDFSNDQSPLFKAYVDELCDRLIEEYDLREKTIVDIGCGDGIFLTTLCKKGNNRGVGIDPGFDHSKRKPTENVDVTFIREYYSEKHVSIMPDFIACRLVIDLLPDQSAILNIIRKNLENSPDTVLYVEVPNAKYTFEERVIWNVVYEHSAWFTRANFVYQFERCGFEVIRVAPCWNDEFLGIEVRPQAQNGQPALPDPKAIQSTLKIIEDFNQDFQQLMNQCRQKIENIRDGQIKTIAWGAGARAVTFFNLFNIRKEVPFIIDINDKRHEKYLPGSGHKIVAPEFIKTYRPELVIITNPTYAGEIKAHVRELGVDPEFWVL